MKNVSGETDSNYVDTDILIVGFGYSVIPLIRELNLTRTKFTVISDGKAGVWDRLAEAGRLDFDLVSSLHSSVFSWVLTEMGATADRYQTSKEFAAVQRKLKEEYFPKDYVKDTVTRVENMKDGSLVHTQSGTVFRAKHVVISTAFRRDLLKELTDFDFQGTEGKTIIVNTAGDTGNLICAKLVPRGNRVIMRSNGFLILDKFVHIGGQNFPLDQLEYHNVRHLTKWGYKTTIDGGTVMGPLLGKIGNALNGSNFYAQHPSAHRRDASVMCDDAMPNGILAIKAWPIDTHKQLFDNEHLEQSIRDGFLLNDLPFFVDKGLVELCRKDESELDKERKVLRWKGEEIKYDYVFDAQIEDPNLPPILTASGTSYEHNPRKCFMGTVPEALNNVYILGITRPTTGGLATIIEMQGLLTHRLLTDAAFHRSITSNLSERIRKYDQRYYVKGKATNKDHIVWYGSFTEDIAELLGINWELRRSRSLRELAQYFLLPNLPLKFRRSGRYKVEGAAELLEDLWERHDKYSTVANYFGVWGTLQGAAMLALLFSPMPLALSLPLVAAQYFNPLAGLMTGHSVNIHPQLTKTLGLGMLGSLVTRTAAPATGALAVALGALYVGRKKGWTRHLFNDMKMRQRPEFGEYFERYRKAFLRVHPSRMEGSDATRPRSTSNGRPASAAMTA